MKKLTFLVFLFSSASLYSQKFDGLALTPPMGWNSFDSYDGYLHEEAAKANIEEMAKTYLPYGYEYFVIDIGWYGEYKLIPGRKCADKNYD